MQAWMRTGLMTAWAAVLSVVTPAVARDPGTAETADVEAVVNTAPVAVGPSRILLKGGYEIRGDVLKSTGTTLVVFIAGEILRLGQDQVLTVEADTAGEGPVLEAAHDEWQIYRRATLPLRRIEEHVERFGEAVVMVTSPGGLGSGFVIHPDGYLITNYHVIAQETRIRITVFRRSATGFEQKQYPDVKIIALNPFVDLALLKIENTAERFAYVYLGDIGRVEAGQEVFAIGNPLGLTRTVSQGIVSTENRNFEGRLYIQTTTDINPGNSGGPLFNLRGEVIGVTSMGYLFLGGLNFAIPVDVVQRFVDNRDAFAYDEDNPNSGFRYLQPSGRVDDQAPPAGRLPHGPRRTHHAGERP